VKLLIVVMSYLESHALLYFSLLDGSCLLERGELLLNCLLNREFERVILIIPRLTSLANMGGRA
jgi:hypothetical protein